MDHSVDLRRPLSGEEKWEEIRREKSQRNRREKTK